MREASGDLLGAAEPHGIPTPPGWTAGVLVLGGCVVASLGLGAVAIRPSELVSIATAQLGWHPFGWSHESVQESVLMAIRLPRVLLCGLVGAALASSGAAIQGVFRNPLADPGLIGVSAGAAAATATAIVVGPRLLGSFFFSGLEIWLLPLAGFLGGTATTWVIVRLARRESGTVVSTMLLAGIAINALAGAITGFIVFLADDAQLRDITFWSLGSLGGATWAKVWVAALLMLPCVFVLPRLAGALNALLLGENDALLLGVDAERLKRQVILLSALAVGAAVSMTGVIGFVGLVVPHLIRLALGPDHRSLLPGSAIWGASCLLLADLLSRTVVAPAEMPIGTFTAAAGAPFFLWMLSRRGDTGWV